MTVTEALNELSILEDRIEKATLSSTFVVANKLSNTRIGGENLDAYKTRMVGDWKSVNDLIKRYDLIKRAVTQSNATAEVSFTDVSGKEITMTVAAALEYKKHGLEFRERLLQVITNQYDRAKRTCDTENGALEGKASDFIQKLFSGKEKDTAPETIAAQRELYYKTHGYELIDPNSAAKAIESLSAEIDAFKSRIQTALTVSNATTFIEVEE